MIRKYGKTILAFVAASALVIGIITVISHKEQVAELQEEANEELPEIAADAFDQDATGEATEAAEAEAEELNATAPAAGASAEAAANLPKNKEVNKEVFNFQ